MEPIDEEVGDFVDLEDVSESKQVLNSTACTKNTKEDDLQQPAGLKEPIIPDLLID